MVARGDLGKLRLVVADFTPDFHADVADAANPCIRWRYGPAQAGTSSVPTDAGIHAVHMVGYVIDQHVEALSTQLPWSRGDAVREAYGAWVEPGR